MRRYLPALIVPALGVAFLLWYYRGDDPEPQGEPTPPPKDTPTAEKTEERKFLIGDRVKTPTPLDKFAPLSELERAFMRKDRSHAGTYRKQVAMRMAEVKADPELRQNLLNLIRKYGVESQNAKDRLLLFGLLRVFEDPEATRMVVNEYYKAQNSNERIMLLQAMAQPFHDPQHAKTAAVQMALTSENEDTRTHALEVIETFTRNHELYSEAAIEIWEGTVRPEQKRKVIQKIANYAVTGPPDNIAKRWMSRQLERASREEMFVLLQRINEWGGDHEANMLEKLSDRYPAMGDRLRSMAREMRERMRREAIARRIQEEQARKATGGDDG